MDGIADRLLVFGLPLLALVWPIVALTLRGRRAWRRWGAGGCFVLGAVMTAVGAAMAGDVSDFLFLLPLPFWLLGVFNLFAGAAMVLWWIPLHRILLPLDREKRDQGRQVDSFWSWRATVVVVAMVAVSTWAGTVLATWPRLPDPAPPQEGQITGVVGEPTTYGWRRLAPHDHRFDVVVAVPRGSFRLFRALDVQRVHEATPQPPVYGLLVRRNDLLDIEGVRLALVHDDAFTLDGLSADVPYWICVGSATHETRWGFSACDRPELAIPGQVRVGRGYGGEPPFIEPLS